MNFLAHLYLSGDSEDIMFGNFIGDFVKGNAYENYSAGVREGILLHRKIDDFTDHHVVVSRSKDLLREKYRHYSGVIVDMYYDHFLARNWNMFHEDPLQEYARKVYSLMLSRRSEMPRGASYMLGFMAEHDWLTSYAETRGIHRALSGMARRTTFVSHMEKAIDDLEENYDIFRDHFLEFFPEVVEYTRMG